MAQIIKNPIQDPLAKGLVPIKTIAQLNPAMPDLGDVTIDQNWSSWNFSGFEVDELEVADGTQGVSIYGGSPQEFYDFGDWTYSSLSSVEEFETGGYRGDHHFGAVFYDSYTGGVVQLHQHRLCSRRSRGRRLAQ